MRLTKLVEEKSKSIKAERLYWNNIAQSVLHSSDVKKYGGKTIRVSQLDGGKVTNLLKSEGITSLSVSSMGSCQEIECRTDWADGLNSTVYLTWTTCVDEEQWHDGYYSQSGFIEVWGLGNNWLIWSDSDPI